MTAPTWQSVYANWVKTHTDKEGNSVDMNRPWNADQGAIDQKAVLDQVYKDQLAQYNFDNGTNESIDQTVLGSGVQPNKFTPTDHSNDGFFGGAAKALGMSTNDFGTLAALAAGGYGLYSSGLFGGGAAALEGMPVASTGGVLTEAGVSGSVAGGLGGTAGALSGAGGGLMSGLGGAASAAGNFLKDNQGLATLGAGLLGTALNKDTTTTNSKDPWGPAQQYMKDNLATNARMQAHYQANPFSQEQKTAYQGLLDTNANGLSNAGNYAQIAQNFMGSNRGLMGQMPTLNTGVKAAPIDWAKYANIGKA